MFFFFRATLHLLIKGNINNELKHGIVHAAMTMRACSMSWMHNSENAYMHV